MLLYKLDATAGERALARARAIFAKPKTRQLAG